MNTSSQTPPLRLLLSDRGLIKMISCSGPGSLVLSTPPLTHTHKATHTHTHRHIPTHTHTRAHARPDTGAHAHTHTHTLSQSQLPQSFINELQTVHILITLSAYRSYLSYCFCPYHSVRITLLYQCIFVIIQKCYVTISMALSMY